VDEQKWRFIDVWCGLEQLIFDEANFRLLTSGEEDFEHVSVLKEDTSSSSTTCELTVLILCISITVRLVSVTCLTVACQQRWPIHSCSLPRDAMQARPMSLCGVRLSVSPCVCHVRTFCQNE